MTEWHHRDGKSLGIDRGTMERRVVVVACSSVGGRKEGWGEERE